MISRKYLKHAGHQNITEYYGSLLDRWTAGETHAVKLSLLQLSKPQIVQFLDWTANCGLSEADKINLKHEILSVWK